MLNWITLFKSSLIATILAASFNLQGAHAQSKLAAGSWTNGLGGTVTISSITPAGQIVGTYVTDIGCNAGKPQPIVGWYYDSENGGAITFSTSLQGCASVVSWAGQYDAKTRIFYTLWHLTAASAPSWNGTIAGAHMFVPK